MWGQNLLVHSSKAIFDGFAQYFSLDGAVGLHKFYVPLARSEAQAGCLRLAMATPLNAEGATRLLSLVPPGKASPQRTSCFDGGHVYRSGIVFIFQTTQRPKRASAAGRARTGGQATFWVA